MQYSYIYSRKAIWKIEEFYMNVSRKYMHTFSIEDVHKNIEKVLSNSLLIEKIFHDDSQQYPSGKSRDGTWQTPRNGTTHTPSTVTQ